MSARLVIITEIISPYRVPVFNALALYEGIDLHVIFLAENDCSERQWLVYKDEIRFSYEVLPSWRQRSGRHTVLLNWGVEAALRRATPDVIVCGGYNYLSSWQSMRWARRHRVPFILWTESTASDLRSGHVFVELMKTKFLRGCNAFVVPGKSSIDYLRNYGVHENKIFVAPNAVDTLFFAQRADLIRESASMHRQALSLPSRFFLFVGRLVQEKGVFDLLSAYEALPPEIRNDVGLVFVGDGAARSALQQRAEVISPGTIHLAGFAQKEDLACYYALAEALVFPTYSDPWGLVVNEAMACGLPVIASNVAGCVADLIENGWNGRAIPSREIGSLTLAMDELARDGEQRSLMGKRSAQRIAQYSPEAWAAGMAQIASLRRERAA